MKVITLLSLVTLLLSIMSTGTVLKQHKWKQRVIIVFTQNDYSEQWKTAKAQLKDRQLIYYQINAEGTIISNNDKDLTAEMAKDLRTKYSKETSSTKTTQVILIGKDGGVKSRTDEFDLKSIYALIDKMPMRQREMKEAK